jgi:PncC family amidohydrolase
MTITENDMRDLAAVVGQLLLARQMTCATAESCTGGLVAHWITEIPGSSAYFVGAAVVYSYEAKERLLAVDHDTLLREGAVSAPVAQQMAQGARRLFDVDVAVAVTGIAGPGGGLPDKPTGTVFLHLSARDGHERGARHEWDSDRSGNKLLSAHAALTMVREYLERRA